MGIEAIGLSAAIGALAANLLSPAPADAAGGIKRRAENQQGRIAQGLASGQLTAREAARLERQEARLNAEVRRMREDNGGTLTREDRASVNHQQNVLSRRIYRQKHDAQVQPR